MVKVLHIAPGFHFGGIESRLVDWYSLIDRDKVRFDVVKVTPEEPNPLVEQLRAFGADIFSIPPLKQGSTLAHYKAMKRILLNGNYDVVHCHSLAYGLIPLRLAKSMGIKKRILHSRTTSANPGDRHQTISRILSGQALRYANNFFACSEEAGIVGFGTHRNFTVVRNGIFLEEFAFNLAIRKKMRTRLGVENDFVIGTVARFSTQKNLMFLLDVFAEFHRMAAGAKLVLVGDGPEMANVIQKITALGMTDNVLLPGRQENVGDWLQCFDAFLMPSHFEGFGTTALEAQASGLPCFLSDVIPWSVDITGSVTFISLDKPANTWADIMMEVFGQPRQPGKIEMIRDAGYDVRTTAKWLEEFYLS